ncbi:ABC transporter permease [Lysobacter soli]|uniref:ABC transporter permease n=1 Tax=Lysobacter soli TaxID=453783 RepID=UPI0012ED60E3|nr:ABC transporter permease [Lysobacter soli]QGW64053.1 ABC transporter permease [Lysobacter soli]
MSSHSARAQPELHDPHKALPASPLEMCLSPWRHRGLVSQMVRREVVGRYKGSMIGLAWSFLNPLLMLAIYTFVFSVVFKARWGVNANEGRVDFAVVLFVGLIVHGLFAECVNRAPTLIVQNTNYVKKVVFPLDILPVVAMGSALFHAIISTLVLLVAIIATGNQLHWEFLLWPVLMLPTALLALGFSWFLSSLGVFIRDVGQITLIFTTALLFLSPVFFPVSSMPEKYQALMNINPLTQAIEQMRGAIIFGRQPQWSGYLVSLGGAALAAWAGFWWFQRTRKGFADVL